MNRRKVKAEVFALLDTSEPADFKVKLRKYPRIPLVNSLFMALCDPRDRIKWHGVYCFGHLVSTMASENTESARFIMRRFLWTLNDESGGIGWGAPEAMAQIMTQSRVLRHEYLHMLISYMREDGEELFQDGNFLELPLLQRGLLWGVGTLCKKFPDEMNGRGLVKDLENYFHSSDEEVRKLALWCCKNLGVKMSSDILSQLVSPDAVLRIYVDGTFVEITLYSIFEQLQTN